MPETEPWDKNMPMFKLLNSREKQRLASALPQDVRMLLPTAETIGLKNSRTYE